jgi:hypothetical protein
VSFSPAVTVPAGVTLLVTIMVEMSVVTTLLEQLVLLHPGPAQPKLLVTVPA